MDSLAPWDAFPFFQNPREFSITDNGTTQQIVAGNPNRFLMVLHCRMGNANWTISTLNQTVSSGIVVSNSTLPTVISYDVWRSLVNIPWFGQADTVGSILSVITLDAYRWPKSLSESDINEILQRSADGISRYNRYAVSRPKPTPLQIDNLLSKYKPGINQLQRPGGIGQRHNTLSG